MADYESEIYSLHEIRREDDERINRYGKSVAEYAVSRALHGDQPKGVIVKITKYVIIEAGEEVYSMKGTKVQRHCLSVVDELKG